MPKSGYTILPVKMRDFLKGEDPTVPQQELEFYDSAERASEQLRHPVYFGRDRLGSAACIVQVSLEDSEIHHYPLPGQEHVEHPHVLGFATLQMDKVIDAAILWNVNGMGKQVCLSAEAGNWEAARQEGWVIREAQFKQQCLNWNTPNGLSKFAENVVYNYMDALMTAQDAQAIDMRTGLSMNAFVNQAVYDVAKQPFQSELDRVTEILSAANAAALQFANEHQMPEFATALQEHCSDFQKFIEPETEFHVNTMGNMRNVAAAHLAFLPEDMRHEVTEMFNNEIWRAYREKPEFTWNLGQYTFSALAVTLDKLSARMNGELLAETAQHWKQCSDEAISRGATREDTCYCPDDQREDIPGNEEQDNEEP